MIKTGSVKAHWSTIYPDAYWIFSWKSDEIANGQTKVEWTLKKGGRAETPTQLDTWCDLSLYYNGSWGEDPLWKSGNLTGENSSFKDGSAVCKEGSFIINHASDGTGKFEVYMKGRIYEKEVKITRQWQEVEKSFPYSKCDDPTNVGISPSIQRPGGTITISWNPGANASTAVDSYDVWYRLGGVGTWYKNNTKETSTTFTLPNNATRGSYIQACVRALGKGGTNYNSNDVYSADNAAKINSLPADPTVEQFTKVVASTGGKATFSGFNFPAKDENDNQEIRFYYSNSLSGTKTEIDSDSLDKTVTSKTEFYFWTWDGLEYCDSPAICVVELNNKPILENLNILNNRDIDGYLYIDLETNKPCLKAKCSFLLTTDRDPFVTDEFSINAKNDNKYETVLDGLHILSSQKGALSGEYTTDISIQVYDGIEWSNQKIYNSSVLIDTPDFVCKNDVGNIAPFSKRIYINSNNLPVRQAYFGSGRVINAVQNNETYLINTESVSYGDTLEYLSIGFLEEDGERFKVVSRLQKVKRIYIKPPKSEDSVFGAPFKAHSDTGIIIKLQQYLGADYGTDLNSPPKLFVEGDNISLTVEESGLKLDYFQYTIKGEDLDSLCNSIFSSTSLPTSLDLTFCLKNEFDDAFYKEFVLDLDYTEEAEITTVALHPGANLPGLNQWAYLKEGMSLYCTAKISSYEPPIVSLGLRGINEEQIEGLKTCFVEKTGEELPRRKTVYEINFNFGKISSITADIENVSFDLLVSATGCNVVHSIFEELTVRAHRPSRVNFSAIEYDGKYLSGEWVISDYGWSNDLAIIETINGSKNIGLSTLYVYAEELEENICEISKDLDKNSFKDEVGFDSNDLLHLAPRLTTTMRTYYQENGNTNFGFETEKTTEIYDYTVVYNKLPTISYRPNYIGINTTFDKDIPHNTAIQIGAYKERDRIYLRGDDRTAHINLKTGGLSGFIVDGGSWDGSSGGVVPGGGGGDVPTGLAAIAYSGNLSDIHQDAVIIITAGGAFD